MITSQERTDAFMAELKALPAKYDAEIEAEDHYSGYAECGEDIRTTVTAYTVYDGEGEISQDRMEINLGRHIDGK